MIIEQELLKLAGSVMAVVSKEEIRSVTMLIADYALIMNLNDARGMDLDCEVYPEGLKICAALNYEETRVTIRKYGEALVFLMR